MACISQRTIGDPLPTEPPIDDGSLDLWETSAPDLYVPPAMPPDGGPPPFLACGADAGAADAAECPLPASRCADMRWLEYWSNGVCVDGACRWTTSYKECVSGCDKGACRIPHLTAQAPQ